MDGDLTYHPAALERAADSIRGVSIHGFRSGVSQLPMLVAWVVDTVQDRYLSTNIGTSR